MPVPVPPEGVHQGAHYIWEWCGGTPLYERQAVIRGGPSAPEGGTPGSAVYYGSGVPLEVFIAGYPGERCISGSGAGGPRYINGRRLFVAVPAGFEPAFSP